MHVTLEHKFVCAQPRGDSQTGEKKKRGYLESFHSRNLVNPQKQRQARRKNGEMSSVQCF
jgi:hypothetical protein